MTLEHRAQKVRKDLFHRYDQLNALWLKAEQELTKHHVPRPVVFCCRSYDLEEEGRPDLVVSECLGLQKIGGKWRICYGSCCNSGNSDEPPDWTAITECSAEVRVDAAEYLPSLRRAGVESAEQFVPRVDQAIQKLSEALRVPENLPELLAERAKLNGKP